MFYLILFTKLFIGFAITILHLNFTGKTQMSQMNAVDLIGNFILGGIIGGVIYSDSISYQTYILALFTGILLINLINWLVKKTPLLRAFTIGAPILLIYNGKFQIDALTNKKNKINIGNITATLRIMGYSSFIDIDFLQIEANGQLSIITKADKKPAPAVIIYLDKTVDTNELDKLKKDEGWLKNKLRELGISQYDDIYLVEYYDDKINVVFNDGTTKH